jgi:hypothetical protein
MQTTGERIIVTCGKPRFESGKEISRIQFDMAVEDGVIIGKGDSFLGTLNQTYELNKGKKCCT